MSIGRKMRRAVYGPLRLTREVTYMGIGEGDFSIGFTGVGVNKGGHTVISWSEVLRIDAHFSARRALLIFDVVSRYSIMAKDSVLLISLKSGKGVAWSFTVPPSCSVGKWNRKNVKILFEELSSLGMLSLLGSSAAAEQLLVRLGTVRTLLPWRRRGQIAGIVMRVGKP